MKIIVPIILILIIAGFIIFATRQTLQEEPLLEVIPLATPEETMVKKELMIQLHELNNSEQSGTASLTQIAGQTSIVVELSGAPIDIPQPAHIHAGSCADLGGVNYPLLDVINGASETDIEVSLDQLATDFPLSINVHKSGPEIDVYVACGDITQ